MEYFSYSCWKYFRSDSGGEELYRSTLGFSVSWHYHGCGRHQSRLLLSKQVESRIFIYFITNLISTDYESLGPFKFLLSSFHVVKSVLLMSLKQQKVVQSFNLCKIEYFYVDHLCKLRLFEI
jgi:hypothetical protein